MQEITLIDRLRQADTNAYREFIEENQDKIFRLCLGFTHNQEDAEEITQDVFVEILNSIQSFRKESKLSTWMYRIAVNKSLNFIKKNKRHKNTLSINSFYTNDENSELEVEDTQQINAYQKLVTNENAKILFNAINELPKNQRVAFVLNKYEDLSYKEVAETMKLSVSAVESLLFRAKINLQKKLINLRR